MAASGHPAGLVQDILQGHPVVPQIGLVDHLNAPVPVQEDHHIGDAVENRLQEVLAVDQMFHILEAFDGDADLLAYRIKQFLPLRSDLVEIYLDKGHDAQHLAPADEGDIQTVLFFGAGKKAHAPAGGLQQGGGQVSNRRGLTGLILARINRHASQKVAGIFLILELQTAGLSRSRYKAAPGPGSVSRSGARPGARYPRRVTARVINSAMVFRVCSSWLRAAIFSCNWRWEASRASVR